MKSRTSRLPDICSVSKLPASTTRPAAAPLRGRLSGVVSRCCPVTASSRESKAIRLSADERELHPAGVRHAPAQAARSRGPRALPLRVRGVEPEQAVAALAPGEHAVEGPFPDPAPAEGQRRPGPPARAGCRGFRSPAARPASEVGMSRPVSAARSSFEKRSSRSSAAQCGGSTVMLPFAREAAELAGQVRVHGEIVQRPFAPETAAQLAPRLERGKRAADPLERERLELHVGGEGERVAAGVQVERSDRGAGRAARRPGAGRCPGR